MKEPLSQRGMGASPMVFLRNHGRGTRATIYFLYVHRLAMPHWNSLVHEFHRQPADFCAFVAKHQL